MPTAHLVHAQGAAIPAIGLGTFTLKGEACARAVADAIAAGYRHIDTAVMYDNEEAVGAGLRNSGVPRGEIFVTTKVWYEDIAPGDLERSAERSLRRLGLDQVDLLLIHWPNAAVPLEASTAALCKTRSRGLARHVGVCNYPSAMLDEAVRLASEPLVVNQCEYHPLLDQTRVIDACRRHGLAFTSYSPLGRSGAFFENPALTALAAKYGKSVAQIVLRWQVQQDGVVAIPKSGTSSRIAENLDVFDFALGPDEMAAIFALRSPNGRIIDPSFAPQWDDT